MDNLKQISYLIEQQFPDLYKREGENLIKFIESYYAWMEQTGQPINLGLSLPETLDIDTTMSEFLSHFRETYMVGLPEAVIGNQRLLQKHILDLYRSKNSKTSIELLFRLLYNKDIEIYLPSSDILRTSDGKWERKTYIEVDYTPDFDRFTGKVIEGSVSGAQASVVAAEQRMIKGKTRYMLFVEDTRGSFIVSENLYFSDDHSPAKILGSVGSVTVSSSVAGWQVGDRVVIQESTTPSSGEGFVGVVSQVYDSDTGMIFPVIVDGGSGFALTSNVTIANNMNTSGADAQFAVGGLANTSVINVTDFTVGDLMGIFIDSPDYDLSLSNVYAENLSSSLEIVMQYYPLTIGTITSLRIINPGEGYDGKVSISVHEERTSRLLHYDVNGNLEGNNAVIDNYAAFGTDLVGEIYVKDSGLGYAGDDETLYLTDVATGTKFATVNLNTKAVGEATGRYVSTDGFLSSTKKLQDSYYYQEYSYEIRVSESLSRYANVVKAVVHPSGTELFGAVKVSDTAYLVPTEQTTITIS